MLHATGNLSPYVETRIFRRIIVLDGGLPFRRERRDRGSGIIRLREPDALCTVSENRRASSPPGHWSCVLLHHRDTESTEKRVKWAETRGVPGTPYLIRLLLFGLRPAFGRSDGSAEDSIEKRRLSQGPSGPLVAAPQFFPFGLQGLH